MGANLTGIGFVILPLVTSSGIEVMILPSHRHSPA
jgi:hypothetical protein